MSEIVAKAQILLRAAPSDVYNAFVDADVMSTFWFTRRDKGLIEGETVYWYVGQAADAFAIEVRVKELVDSERILIEWGHGETFTQVQWRIESTEQEISKLTIEESGYKGSNDEIVAKALDSTGGFNQVVVAVKALLEQNSTINVVASHF